MYKIMSNFYGQISTKNTIEEAIYWANSYATKAETGEIISVAENGIVIYQS